MLPGERYEGASLCSGCKAGTSVTGDCFVQRQLSSRGMLSAHLQGSYFLEAEQKLQEAPTPFAYGQTHCKAERAPYCSRYPSGLRDKQRGAYNMVSGMQMPPVLCGSFDVSSVSTLSWSGISLEGAATGILFPQFFPKILHPYLDVLGPQSEYC